MKEASQRVDGNVATCMSVRFVDCSEVIEIDQCQAERQAGFFCTIDFVAGGFIEMVAIESAGRRIGKSNFCQSLLKGMSGGVLRLKVVLDQECQQDGRPYQSSVVPVVEMTVPE
nr:hypothetical protein [Novimethylophilus kurashikiensis]